MGYISASLFMSLFLPPAASGSRVVGCKLCEFEDWSRESVCVRVIGFCVCICLKKRGLTTARVDKKPCHFTCCKEFGSHALHAWVEAYAIALIPQTCKNAKTLESAISAIYYRYSNNPTESPHPHPPHLPHLDCYDYSDCLSQFLFPFDSLFLLIQVECGEKALHAKTSQNSQDSCVWELIQNQPAMNLTVHKPI